MGWYLRKSVRVGPVRFNLSKSGVGTSVGVRGLRLGTGPRGNYVHMGRNGVYFRQTLPSVSSTRRPGAGSRSMPPVQTEDPSMGGWTQEVQSASALELRASSASELVEEIATKRAKLALFPVVTFVVVAALVAALAMHLPQWVVLTLILSGVWAVALAYYFDEMRKKVVLLYELEEPAQSAYEQLQSTFDGLRRCAVVWQLQSEIRASDYKYSAGADTLGQRKQVKLSRGQVANVRTNVEVPKIQAGSQTLAFMPDQLLVFDPSGVGSVLYDHLRVEVSPVTAVESPATLPRDARVVEYSWQFVNKDGGPDLRFTNNPRFPIAEYEKVTLQSGSGLNMVLFPSQKGVGAPFKHALAALGAAARTIDDEPLPTAPPAPTVPPASPAPREQASIRVGEVSVGAVGARFADTAGADKTYVQILPGHDELRPTAFNDFIGHEAQKQTLLIMLEAARARGEVPGHLLITGASGTGKTTFSRIAAGLIDGVPSVCSADEIRREEQLASILVNVRTNGVLIVEDVDRLSPPVEVTLRTAMQYVLDVVIDEGQRRRNVRLTLPPFTVVGTAESSAEVPSALLEVFDETFHLRPYTIPEIEAILLRSATILGVALDRDAGAVLAQYSSGKPRDANRLLKRVNDYAQVRAGGHITREVAMGALALFQTT